MRDKDVVKFGFTLWIALVFVICGCPLQALTGDLNCNGRVDLSDFFVLADNFGTQGEVGSECTALVGDFDCDNSVDLTDFFILADNFGKEGVVELGCETVAGETEEDDIGSGDSSPNVLLIIADDLGVDATPGYPVGAEKPACQH